MKEVQEVIIYRSPVEKGLYDMMAEYPNAVLLFFGVIIMLFLCILAYEKWANRRM